VCNFHCNRPAPVRRLPLAGLADMRIFIHACHEWIPIRLWLLLAKNYINERAAVPNRVRMSSHHDHHALSPTFT
jgi:hypothetical protein